MILHIHRMPFIDDAQGWTFSPLLHDSYIPFSPPHFFFFGLLNIPFYCFWYAREIVFAYIWWLVGHGKSNVCSLIRQSLLLWSFEISDRSFMIMQSTLSPFILALIPLVKHHSVFAILGKLKINKYWNCLFSVIWSAIYMHQSLLVARISSASNQNADTQLEPRQVLAADPHVDISIPNAKSKQSSIHFSDRNDHVRSPRLNSQYVQIPLPGLAHVFSLLVGHVIRVPWVVKTVVHGVYTEPDKSSYNAAGDDEEDIEGVFVGVAQIATLKQACSNVHCRCLCDSCFYCRLDGSHFGLKRL